MRKKALLIAIMLMCLGILNVIGINSTAPQTSIEIGEPTITAEVINTGTTDFNGEIIFHLGETDQTEYVYDLGHGEYEEFELSSVSYDESWSGNDCTITMNDEIEIEVIPDSPITEGFEMQIGFVGMLPVDYDGDQEVDFYYCYNNYLEYEYEAHPVYQDYWRFWGVVKTWIEDETFCPTVYALGSHGIFAWKHPTDDELTTDEYGSFRYGNNMSPHTEKSDQFVEGAWGTSPDVLWQNDGEHNYILGDPPAHRMTILSQTHGTKG